MPDALIVSRARMVLVTVLLLTTLCLLVIPSQPAQAAEINIPCGGSGANDLIAAIMSANSTPENDTINLAASCLYTLTGVQNVVDGNNGLPSILDAATSGTLTINGNNSSIVRSGDVATLRFFHIATGGSLTLNRLTLSTGSSSLGGAIFNRGTLTGRRVLFLLNDASLSGGGIYSDNGTVSLYENRFYNNTSGFGGGLFGKFSTMSVSGSTFNNNGASMDGGGAYSEDGTLNVDNSTFYQNEASYAGGLMLRRSDATLSSVTIVGNSALNGGGGVYNETSTVQMANTLIAQNVAFGFADEFSGTVTSAGYNLIANTGGTTITGTTTGNLINGAASPLNLGTFGSNGGNTQTIPLQAGSVAINAGNHTHTEPPYFEQRGSAFPRVQNGRMDIGAFEVTAACPSFPVNIPDGNEEAFVTAVRCAGVNSSNDVINLAPGGTYIFTAPNNTEAIIFFDHPIGANALPLIRFADTTGTLTINGNGALLARDANAPDFRFFTVVSSGNLSLNNLYLVDGRAEFQGGALLNHGVLALNGISASGNAATSTNLELGGGEGGVIYNDKGALNIFGSNFTDNSAADVGGVLYGYEGNVVIANTTFDSNSAPASGAIWLLNGLTQTATIENSTFIDNSAQFDGGAIIAYDYDLLVTASTFTNNSADRDGGGIFNYASVVTVNNSTLSGNSASRYGGGLYGVQDFSSFQTFNLNHTTVVGNSATFGGGLYAGRVAQLSHSLFANNSATNLGPDIFNVVDSLNYNLISNTANMGFLGGAQAGDLLNANASPVNLGTLADNGGLTRTIALMPGSVAINRGNPSFVSPPNNDQRGSGFPRVQSGRIDIGAYETSLTSTLNLQLMLQGRPTAPHAQWETTVHIQIRPTGGGAAILTSDYTSNNSGQIVIAGLPTGSYNLWVKGTHTLARVQAVTLSTGTNNATTAILLEGDANDDNLVTLPDFSILATAFGRAFSQAGYDARADFNGDTIITINDFSLLASNFGQVGTP